MCKCDYGNCSQSCVETPECRCHIGQSIDVIAAVKSEREWWHKQLVELKCLCKTKHRNNCVRKAAERMLKMRPM